MEKDQVPTFGHQAPAFAYEERRASYAVILRDGLVATVRGPRGGHFLPGGGQEAGEMPEATVRREIAEELARECRLLGQLGEARQFFFSPSDNKHFDMRAVFFKAELMREEVSSDALEEFVWLPLAKAREKLFHACHVWAVEEAVKLRSVPLRLPVIVLVTGTTGTGKTTLARTLSERFDLPLFYKDGFKERMFDLASPDGDYAKNIDREFSRLLGRFSLGCLEVALEQIARTGVNAVFEANFDSRLFSPHLLELRKRHPFLLVQIRLFCEVETLTDRFIAREMIDRHPGHGGMRHRNRNPDLLKSELEVLLRNDRPLAMEAGDDLFEIDTTDLAAIDYEPLYTTIAQRLMASEAG